MFMKGARKKNNSRNLPRSIAASACSLRDERWCKVRKGRGTNLEIEGAVDAILLSPEDGSQVLSHLAPAFSLALFLAGDLDRKKNEEKIND